MRQRTFARLMLVPATLVIAAFLLIPLVRVLLLSVTDPHLGFDNYLLLFRSASIQRVIWTTVRIAAIATVFAVFFGYVIAYAMTTSSGLQARMLLIFVLLPFWTSVLVRSFAWIVLLNANGVVNAFLLDAQVVSEPLRLVRNEFGVLIGMIHVMIPFAALPLYASMLGVDRRLVDAARGMGATPSRAFVRVFFPLTRPGLFAALLLVFIMSLGFFTTPAVLGGGRTFMLAEFISVQVVQTVQWGVGTMLATVLLLSILAILSVLWRFGEVRHIRGATA